MKSLILAFFLLSTVSAFATVEINKDLKQLAINKFLLAANDPTSEIGIAIIKINEDSADGRNTEGTIKMPVKADELQIVFTGGETLYNPWKYSEKNETETACIGYSETASFLIFLSQHSAVHGAMEFSTFTFTIETKKMVKAEYKDGRKIEYCSEFSDDSHATYFKFSTPELTVDRISQVEMKDIQAE